MGADIVNLANVLSTQTAAIAPDAQAKQVLKEAVDAVVNSFAKHTQGYGRGKLQFISYTLCYPPPVTVILFSTGHFCLFSHIAAMNNLPGPIYLYVRCILLFSHMKQFFLSSFQYFIFRSMFVGFLIKSKACDRTNHF